jgi:hypothetical protein
LFWRKNYDTLGGKSMMLNSFWIIRADANRYRIFSQDKNSRFYNESVKLLRDGKSLSEIWEPVFLPLYSGNPDDGDEEREKSQPIPDFAMGIFNLAMSEKAYLILRPLIADQAVFLELNTEAGLYYELDIQKINCLNLENSPKIFFPSGKIMRIEKYSFFWDKLENVHIFNAANVVLSPDFASNQFKEMVEKNNLTGLTFSPIPLADN